jgi:uncharacterized protein YidB (DUF937 family)
MGLLDGVLGGGAQGGRQPGLGDTIAAGAVLALLVKAVRQYQANHPGGAGAPPGAAAQPQPGSQGGAGGLGGLFGGMLSGGGLGGLLGSLGGAGALGALVNRFQQKGFGAQAGSWVGNGPNQPIAPHQVGDVLGDGALQELEARTGLPRDELLQELARELPQAISAATPNGRLPQDHELQQQLGA